MTNYSRYPARVRVERADGTVVEEQVRAALVVKDGSARAAAFRNNRRSDGVEVFAEQTGVIAVEPAINREVTVRFEDGSRWVINKGDGCSCHNALSRWYTEERGRPARSGIS